ncbi:MAG: TrmH family RNA methyltransferase [Anaerolineales bacterium]
MKDVKENQIFVNVSLRRYKKSFVHSYVFGVFPTLELLQHKPEIALGVLFHSRGRQNQGNQQIKIFCEKHDIPYQVNDKMIKRLTNRGNDYAVGIFRKVQLPLDPNADHIVLHNPSGMGNLGTIMRSMVGYDMKNLAIIEPSVDPFDPKVVRASMGAIFQLNIQIYRTFQFYSDIHEYHYYPFLTDGQYPLNETNFQSPFALIFGNESRGLDKGSHEIGTSVQIPHSAAIDSLNISLAVGVSLYQIWVNREKETK